MAAPAQVPSLATSGARIGSIFGIDIVLHPSWLFSALLLTWFSHEEIVGAVLRRPSAAEAWGLAFLFALAISACILGHELAHSVIARLYGLPVRRIVLFVFGGVSLIEREAPTPRAEFAISVAGPLASVVIATGFAGVMRVLHPSIEGIVGAWGMFAAINMALALFNLIPAFPMDGGRVLRSALWAVARDRARATRWASSLGKAFGTIMIGAGVVLAFTSRTGEAGSGRANGLWFMIVGWYLFGAAGSAGRSEGASRPNARRRRDPRGR